VDLLLKLVTTVAAAIGAWVAFTGLQTWRAQLIGRTEYDLARRVLRGVLEVREQIAAVRGPFMSTGEMAAALKEEGVSEPNLLNDAERRKATHLAYDRRWRRMSKAVSDLQVDVLEAEVILGEGIRIAHKALLACVTELYSTLTLYLRAEGNESLQRKLGDKLESYFEIVYLTSNDPAKDPFSAKVSAAVREFEQLLRPHLSLARGVRVVARDEATSP